MAAEAAAALPPFAVVTASCLRPFLQGNMWSSILDRALSALAVFHFERYGIDASPK